MTKIVRKSAVLASAAALVAVALGIGPAPQARAAEPVSIVLNSQANEAGFPLWLAEHLGYFKEGGLAVKIQYFANGGAALASGAAGEWQAGWTGSPPAITGWAKFGLIPVGTMMKEDRNIKLIMRKDALKGKTPAQVLTSGKIGTVPNSTWSQVLYACAHHFKVDPQSMKIVPLDPPVTRQALRSGEIQAGTTDSSPDYDLVHDTAHFEVVCDGKVGGTSVIDPYIVTPRFA
jgi:ABC-type nitrate/sulfonate/bicarbonate transport system substrate-binding protein